ncbi:MAG: hypothetical protein VYD19_00430, partial [Myxococcota bacterium]|nr:hypothetical protein [Myxococcota bacterium]
MSEQGQSSPAATLAALPAGLRRDLERFADAIQAPLPKEGEARRARLLAADEEGELLAQGLIQALDGQNAAQLEEVLDWLRERGVYDVSTALLEAAWGLDLPLDLLGRIAEDWIGAIFFGIGDRVGAEEVARHLVPRAKALGPAFANDLSHFLMGLKLREAARPLVHFAGTSLPGDDSARFHLGIMHKFDCEWAESARCFEEILERREDQASRWNLAIARVALRDWEAARESWSALQIQLPPGEG